MDAHWQRIYRWSAASRQLSTVQDNPLDPINLAFDKSGNLMVVSYTGNGTVYAFKPDDPERKITLLKPEPAVPRPGMTPVLAVGNWAIFSFVSASGVPSPRSYQYVSPDGTTYISAGEDFAKGVISWGIKSADLLRGFGIAPAVAGKRFYLTGEADVRTWSAVVGDDGNFSDLKLFAEQGGEGVTCDS